MMAAWRRDAEKDENWPTEDEGIDINQGWLMVNDVGFNGEDKMSQARDKRSRGSSRFHVQSPVLAHTRIHPPTQGRQPHKLHGTHDHPRRAMSCRAASHGCRESDWDGLAASLFCSAVIPTHLSLSGCIISTQLPATERLASPLRHLFCIAPQLSCGPPPSPIPRLISPVLNKEQSRFSGRRIPSSSIRILAPSLHCPVRPPPRLTPKPRPAPSDQWSPTPKPGFFRAPPA